MSKNIREKKPKYYLNTQGAFIIENFNFAKPFANFFPGIAGKYGIPMWVFYVNRGQAIASFGTKDKDHSILEFFPANKAWQNTSLSGFRTFIKIFSAKKSLFYEPFHNGFVNLEFDLSNQMQITSYDLKLEEVNRSLGLKIKVEYFTIPNDNFAGLARILSVENTRKSRQRIQLLDGLPQVVPFGTSNLFLKKLSRTIEAWMKVENLERGVPFYKLDVDPTDRPEIIHIKEGNFYLGFHYDKGKLNIVTPIVNPEYIFGPVTDFSCPYEFLRAASFRPARKQLITSKTPAAFSLLELDLAPREEKLFFSLIGTMRSRELLNLSIAKITQPVYLRQKGLENKKVIEELQSGIATNSSSKEFDLYAKQTYLDNILRGGHPIIFGPKKTVFYLYSRKHGDLERDYNKFQLQPTYFSQGNGNYRDMNQNRRNDCWFNPEIENENLIYFFNLLQADGFNPLVVKGASFILSDTNGFKEALNDLVEEKEIERILSFLNKQFTPGEFILFLEENKIKLKTSFDNFLGQVIAYSIKTQEAEHGEGFWTDHWTYNLDLLESFLGLWPEKYQEILFEKKLFTFYDNTEVVKPRKEKYVLKAGSVRQLHSVVSDNAKREMLRKRTTLAHVVRTQYGSGEIYQTTLFNKLLCLLVNKLASLDPFGCGIEMEADKPNWFDALNGLPGLLGSSLCETFELKRLVILLKNALEKIKLEKIYITEEIYAFLVELNNLLKAYQNQNNPYQDYNFWDASHLLKEDYRKKIRFGFSGKELEIESAGLISILNNALLKINSAIAKAKDKKRNIYFAYFINEVVKYEPLKEPFVMPLEFRQKKLPLFLEGQMHALRLTVGTDEAKSLYQATKRSELFDKKLKAYKVTASLANQPEEIGRCTAFTPGWLENESIWLHMEYKYLLEMLKQGLYVEFYADFKNVLIPFQKPEKYGRSTLENSSFIVSSAFPEKSLQGNGFVARLSGSTAEFLHIWLIMNIGKNPFFVNERGELNLRIQPILVGWLFDRKGMYSFNFLGEILVTYHNPKRKDTFGKHAATIKRIILKGYNEKPVEISSHTIPAPYAQSIRSCQIKQIEIFLD